MALVKGKNELIAALDVGSTKLCCFIARADEEGNLRVIGIGHHSSEGVKAGEIVDVEAAELSIVAAVHAAEQMAGETIQSVFVNLSNGQPSSQTLSFEVSIAGHEVNDADMRRVVDRNSTRLNSSH